MLYKFKSKAAGDVIMLEANGKRVLGIIGNATGHAYGTQGILQPAQMKTAADALDAAINQEEADQKSAKAQAHADSKMALPFESVSLRQRAHPLIEMLRRCESANEEIVWGV